MKQTKSAELILDIWNNISQEISEDNFRPDLATYKKLFKFIEVGPSYYIIFKLTKVDLDLVSETASTILGYDLSEFTMPFYVSLIHAEDQKWYANAGRTTRINNSGNHVVVYTIALKI